MLISVGVVAYNEESYLNHLLDDLKKQTYPHQSIEILLVDSCSTDQTRSLMMRFKENHDFYGVEILDNPKKIQSSGWNVVFKYFKGEAIIRVDAHASIDPDFVKNNVLCLESGEYVCGGVRPNIIDEQTPWKKTLLCAESSMFGSSIASYRRHSHQEYVKSLFHACYRREVLEKVGGFNESLGRTEDNEFHYRIRQAGYQICMNHDILSYQMTRTSWAKMLKQKYGNGYWVGLTSGVCPGCLSLYHFIPFLFVGAIILTSLLALYHIFWPCVILWGLYGLVNLLNTVVTIFQEEEKTWTLCLLPILFLSLHISYGIGTLVGLIKMPWFIPVYRRCTSAKEVKQCLVEKKM